MTGKELVNMICAVCILILCSFYTISIAQVSGNLSQTSMSSLDDEKKWQEDWDAGFDLAAKVNKPVLVDFCSTQSLTPEFQVAFSAPAIKKRLTEDWVTVRIKFENYEKTGTYADKTMSYHELSKYFRIRSRPALLFIDKNGKPVQIISGSKLLDFYKDDTFLGFILDYMKDETYKKGISFKEYREQINAK